MSILLVANPLSAVARSEIRRSGVLQEMTSPSSGRSGLCRDISKTSHCWLSSLFSRTPSLQLSAATAAASHTATLAQPRTGATADHRLQIKLPMTAALAQPFRRLRTWAVASTDAPEFRQRIDAAKIACNKSPGWAVNGEYPPRALPRYFRPGYSKCCRLVAGVTFSARYRRVRPWWITTFSRQPGEFAPGSP